MEAKLKVTNFSEAALVLRRGVVNLTVKKQAEEVSEGYADFIEALAGNRTCTELR